jgi:hypothetical protein
MTCINDCGKSYDIAITAFPTAAQMAAKNPVVSINGENKSFNVGSFAGNGAGEGITANFAKWTVTSDAANGSYINVVVAPDAGEVASNVKFNATGAKSIEFNVMPNGEAFADLKVDVEVSGTAKTLVSIANTGWISINGYKTTQIDTLEASWTRIAIVACDDKTIDVYVNGQYARSIWLDVDAVFGNATIAVGEGATGDAGLYIDEIYALGELSFTTGEYLEFDDKQIRPDTATFSTQGYITNKPFNNLGVHKASNQIVYKNNCKFVVESMTDVFYGDEAETTKDVIRVIKNSKVANSTVGYSSGNDTHFSVGDLAHAKTNYMCWYIKFNNVEKASFHLIQGRHQASSGGKFNDYLLVKSGYLRDAWGNIQKLENDTWYKIEIYMNSFGNYEHVIYVNGVKVKYNADVKTADYKNLAYTAATYKAFNMTANDADVTIAKWNICWDVKMPADAAN